MMDQHKKMVAYNQKMVQNIAQQSLNQNLNMFKSNIGSGNINIDGNKYSFKNGIMTDEQSKRILSKQESDQILNKLKQSQKLTMDSMD